MRQQMRVGVVAAMVVVSVAVPVWAQGQVTTVPVIQPRVRNIVRVVTRPSVIESYERASIQSKLTAYIEKWNVDIGDKVRKGDVLASLFVPELLEDSATKQARVVLAKQRVELARELVIGAEADLAVASARVNEARSALTKYQAQVDRWAAEVTLLQREVDRGVVDPKVLAESRAQWKSSTAALDSAKAAIATTEAETHPKQVAVKKAALDVQVARADLNVAVSEANRLRAWTSYLKLTSPFDGIVVSRNANTFDLVQPAAGAVPIYVVDRTDIVRVFVGVPENDAPHVYNGTKASVLVRAFPMPIAGRVTRTSWALNGKDRTLRAEIDLPNPGSQLLPGMHADVEVVIERPGVRAVPIGAVDWSGNKTLCWMCENGRVVRTEIDTGTHDGEWIEVMNRRHATGDRTWTPINGSEQVILGDRSHLADGAPIKVAVVTSEADVANMIRGDRAAKESTMPDAGRPNHHSAVDGSGAGQVEDHGMNEATAALDRLRVELAQEKLKVAEAVVAAAEARCDECRLILTQREVAIERWDHEVKRLKREVDQPLVDPEILTESTNQLKLSTAARDAAKGAIVTAAAELRMMKAKLAKAQVEVKLAQAATAVGQGDTRQQPQPGPGPQSGHGPH